jgi:hypothetical protein
MKMRIDRHGVVAVAGAAALFVGGASAVAASGNARSATAGARCDRVLAKIAERRGVTADQLTATLQARVLARIDAAEKAGKISSTRAAALRERVASGNVCRAGAVRRHVALRGMVGAAASFLGLDRQQLRAQLPGTSLAALAAKQGKSEADLEAAMVAPARARLAKAVSGGKLSQARADQALTKLQAVASKLAQTMFPAK